ncbi:M23 family metallopeptidase [Candidatus Dojkabacteria bacterium]|nr:M23 family metallopeptidase [Candidatus Dojkabacteria bacterium]
MKHKTNLVSYLTSSITIACLFFSISTANIALAADEITISATKNLTISANLVTKSVIDYGSEQKSSTQIVQQIELPQEKFDPNYFMNPLSDESCDGYTTTRGWTRGHTGVDLQKKGGCWISAVASGTVTQAGTCPGGLGFCTVIEHDNGMSSLYAHGNGDFKVKEGFRVNPGDKIMYMGCSGRCTGTHLHFSLLPNGTEIINEYSARINPVGIVPLS